MYVDHRFALDPYTVDMINDMEPQFGYDGFGEFIFYRTYSRVNKEGKQETWNDVVIRVIEGTFSIRKDWYIKTRVPWNEEYWQMIARDMAISMFKMEWLPPGRGLWAMGTDFIYERGGMALANCGYTEIGNDYEDDLAWLMDSLMLGVGVGFTPYRNDNMKFKNPKGDYDHIIGDSREEWVKSIVALLEAYKYGASKPKFIYDEIRDAGLPIKGFGGIASGPEPLKLLHTQIQENIELYESDKYYDSVIFKMDCANQIGCMVVSGNVRRSAELACLSINDPIFKDLKDYKKYPRRAEWGWMSNNSTDLECNEDFELLPDNAERISINGEPGFKNLRNFKYGRINKKDKVKKDKAKGTNACAEQMLEHRETCIIDETFPTVCNDSETWLKACEYATLYCSTVSLLPTHQPSTNKVVARNRRIGVGIVDFTGWVANVGMSQVIKLLRKGYKTVRRTNQEVNAEAGVPESIRVTTVKPGGTVPKLAGKTSGCMYPNFHYMIRRVRVARNSPIHSLVVEANVPYENDWVSQNTDVFEFPLRTNPDVPEAGDVSIWQQAMNLITLQREWADNAVSNTLNFRPKWILQKYLSVYDGDEDINNLLKDYLDQYYSFNKRNSILDIIKEKDQYEDLNYKINIKWNEDFTEITEANIYRFDPKNEEGSLEALLASIAPVTKTGSILPHTAKGVYKQSPEEGITEEEYLERKALIKPIDWSKLSGSDGVDEKFCVGETCSIL